MAHNYYRTPKCVPCCLAAKLYMRQRRVAKASLSRYTFPIRLGPMAYEMEGLGLTIARAIRESA